MADEMQQSGAPTGNAPQASPAPAAGASEMKKDVKGLVAQLEAFLDEYMVTKAPFHLPMGLKEFLAKVAPYLTIIFSILAVPAILALLGLSTMLAPVGMMAGGMSWGWWGIVSVVTSIATLALQVMAIPGLFKRTHAAWRLLFYASMVSVAGSLLSLNLIGAIVGAIIGWYILFQMKEMYKA